jgi:putative Ca2+/H+ antiporter (TMEM165/GDT1 family)
MSGQETFDDEAASAAAAVKGNSTNQAVAMVTLPWAIVSKAFTLIFIAEWGDRTQFATIALAAAQNPVGIAIGATLGHSICALIAVLCSRLVATRVSEKSLTLLGGTLFVVFGVLALIRAL